MLPKAGRKRSQSLDACVGAIETTLTLDSEHQLPSSARQSSGGGEGSTTDRGDSSDENLRSPSDEPVKIGDQPTKDFVSDSEECTVVVQEVLATTEAVTNIVLECMEGGKWYHCKGGTFQMVR